MDTHQLGIGRGGVLSTLTRVETSDRESQGAKWVTGGAVGPCAE